MQIAQKAAERERRGGVVARERGIGIFTVLREHGFFRRLQVEARVAALHAAGESVGKQGFQLLVRIRARAQHRFGRRKARKLIAQMLRTVRAGKGGDVRVACGHIAERDARVLLVEEHAAQEVAAPVVQTRAVDHRAGGDDADDVALDEALGQRRVLGLLTDGDLVALGDEPRDVAVARMVRDAAHRRLLLGGFAAVARGENEIQLARGELRVLVEHLVEVAEAEKEDGILILLLDLKILAHHRREVCHVRSSLSKKSDRKGRSGRHVGEAVAQRFVQPGVSVVAGAVAGDIACRFPRAQALAHRVHKGSRLALAK